MSKVKSLFLEYRLYKATTHTANESSNQLNFFFSFCKLRIFSLFFLSIYIYSLLSFDLFAMNLHTHRDTLPNPIVTHTYTAPFMVKRLFVSLPEERGGVLIQTKLIKTKDTIYKSHPFVAQLHILSRSS